VYNCTSHVVQLQVYITHGTWQGSQVLTIHVWSTTKARRQGKEKQNSVPQVLPAVAAMCMLPFESWQSSKVGRVSSSGKVGTPIHHQSAKRSIRRASRGLQRVPRKREMARCGPPMPHAWMNWTTEGLIENECRDVVSSWRFQGALGNYIVGRAALQLCWSAS